MMARITSVIQDEVRIEVQSIQFPWIWQPYMVVRQNDRFSIAYPGRANCYAWIASRLPLKGFGPRKIEAMIRERNRFHLVDTYRDPDEWSIRELVRVLNRARLILKRSCYD